MSDVQGALERILELSKADDCIAIAYRGSSANIRWANNTSTTNGATETTQLYIISVIDRAAGVISRNYFPEDRLEDLVRESEAACKGKPQAQDYMPLLAGDGTPDDWNAPFEPTTIGVFESFAPALGETFRRAEAADVKLFGYAEHNASTVWLATSTGIRRRHRDVEGSVEINAKSPDFKRSVWVGRVTKDFRDVDVPSLYEHLGQRLEWAKTRIDLDPGHYQVLLEPAPVADMLLYAMYYSTARDADEGRTAFSKPGGGNRLGEKLYRDTVSLYSDPAEPGFETTPFSVSIASSSYASIFDNGLSAPRTQWIADGVLKALITPRYWAEKSGTEPTPLPGNLLFDAPEGPSLDDMIATTKRALLVTCFWYIRVVDPQTMLLTGLTRDGVFLVEDGRVVGAVNNFRYNMSPVQMLAQVSEVGKALPTLPREFGFALTKMPPLRVEGFNMSSVSEAT